MTGNWKNILIIIIFTAFFSTATPLFAQFDQQDFGSRINIRSSPEIPGAYEDATISLNAVSYDLNRANIQWLVNNKEVESGFGKSSTSIKTGGAGVETIVTAIITFGSVSTTKKLIIRPSEVKLLWQAIDSYVPPFYKGKALPSSESLINIVAIPNLKDQNGKSLKEKDFTFSWKRNYNPDQEASGYGKNSFTIKNNYMNDDESIEVTATSIVGNYIAKKSIKVPIYLPIIIFYENRPLFGTNYDIAINNDFTMYSTETAIIAEPYFFSPNYIENEDLVFGWRVNSTNVSSQTKNKLIIRNEGQNGTVKINLSVENVAKLFQSLSKMITIKLP